MNRYLVLLLSVTCLFSAPTSAQQVAYYLSQTALNKFATAVGSISGDAGQYAVEGNAPCIPDFWDNCVYIAYQGDLSWTISSPQFSVTPAGVTLGGVLTAKWGSLGTYSTPISAAVNVAVEANAAALDISVGNVSVPITILGITVTTLSFSPSYNLRYPLGTTTLTLLSGSQALSVLPQNVSVTPQSGQVGFSAGIAIW
jgi:hypothetical protein